MNWEIPGLLIREFGGRGQGRGSKKNQEKSPAQIQNIIWKGKGLRVSLKYCIISLIKEKKKRTGNYFLIKWKESEILKPLKLSYCSLFLPYELNKL